MTWFHFCKRIKWEMGDTFFKFSLMKFSRLYNRSQSYDSFQMVPSSPSCGSDSGLTSDHDTIGPVSSPYQTFKLEEDSIPVTNSSSIGKNLNWRLLCNFTKFCYKNNEYIRNIWIYYGVLSFVPCWSKNFVKSQNSAVNIFLLYSIQHNFGESII